ncbi:hypothetical protein BIW15_23025 [Vibrio sp. SALL6]|nr:hypothetical protein BIW15_23025 [Vibrio sp. SALL6]
MNWRRPTDLPNMSWRCGYCGDKVSSTKGLPIGEHGDGSGQVIGGIWICSNCHAPTFFSPNHGKFPESSFGNAVSHVPEELYSLYKEARRCTSQNCYTAAVLLCRKILMNIAVELGAEAGKSFVTYINHLSVENYIPPNARHWVDHIRQKGNEANHEVHAMTVDDAKELVLFTEMLLKLVFEFPKLVPSPTET